MPQSDHTIVISPIGPADAEIIEEIGKQVPRAFGFKTEVVPLLDDVDFAFDEKRKQHHSTPILAKLAEAAPPRALKLLAITREDLFIPILTHVYGEAQLGGTSSIISTHRLNEGLSPAAAEDLFRGRVAKEAIHELGHTFKLLHCKDKTCIMHYCRGVKDVDRKSDQLCRYCQILLNDQIKRLMAKSAPTWP